MFTDRVQVHIEAGKGGNGIVAWRREKYIPKGGPSGGNGGRGGSVYIQADKQYFTLDWYRNRRMLKAENGVQGGAKCQQGGKGEDLILKVPCGTLVKDLETGELIADLTQHKEKILLCAGGRGGLGNDFFKTPTYQAPNKCTPGKLGQVKKIELELKLIADVGLVGFPNAGKSTLLYSLTNVRVKIGAYPFTTLRPNLSYFYTKEGNRIFIADIPGIIEGASENRGLGMEFLRHIERTKLLIFVLDSSGIDGRTPADDYRVLAEEITAYNAEILKKPSFVVLNKIDDEEAKRHIADFQRAYPDVHPLLLSALTGEGLEEFVDKVSDGCTTIEKSGESV